MLCSQETKKKIIKPVQVHANSKIHVQKIVHMIANNWLESHQNQTGREAPQISNHTGAVLY